MQGLMQNKAVLVIGIVIIALLGWYFMSSNGGASYASDALITAESADTVNSADERALLETLVNMRSIRLDGNIFKSDAFNSLQDFSKPIMPEPVGKKDPFAPAIDTSGNTGLNAEAKALFR